MIAERTRNHKDNNMSYIAKNLNTGEYVMDLGMRGEYPYSSEVGRLVHIGGETKEYWYATEINPRGKTEVEQDTAEWVAQVSPTPCLAMAWYGVHIACVNFVGVGEPLTGEGYTKGQQLWREDRGYLGYLPASDKEILDLLISNIPPENCEDDCGEYDDYEE